VSAVRLRAWLVVAGITVALLSVAAGASIQQQPIRVGTNLVRVDVYPTKDGEIVDGLTAEDFDVLEDGVPQKVETFEHVVAAIGAHSARTEPSSQRDMIQAVANPRNRVFLIFLDATHVDHQSAHAINQALIDFLKLYLADDDLVGLMTPGMSASQVTFGRKTAVIETGLRKNWDWGRQNRELDPELDKRLIQYGLCYPGTDVGGKMAARSRERATLEALQDALKYLQSVREERKAIVTVTKGWVLYREDPDLLRKRDREGPIGVDKVRVGPTGKLTLEDHRNTVNAMSPNQCDADRAYLAAIDDEKFLREIIDDANRGNASFYMIDPGGLSTRGADRNGAMRTLAENTDGIAVLNSNDLDRGFKRIAADMSSYYLLGYYATNTKPDGRFRAITVRIKKPGVQVRARRGYRAPTVEETAAARRVPEPAAAAEVSDVTAALGRLGRLRPDARFRINAAVSTSGTGALWVAGELQSTGGRPDEFMEGATVSVEAAATDASTSAQLSLKPGERTFLMKLALPAGASGLLDVRARLSSDEGKSAPLSDAVRLDLAGSEIFPLLFRRGPTTGNRLLPVADARYMRTERARLEIPIGPGPRDGKAGSGRLIDRGGLTTQVPVAVGERSDEGSGQRWITADVNLAALSPGDYIVEVLFQREDGQQKVLTPIRVGR
jgi:VWFA-related protein